MNSFWGVACGEDDTGNNLFGQGQLLLRIPHPLLSMIIDVFTEISHIQAVYGTMSAAEIASIFALRYPSHPFSTRIRSFLSLSTAKGRSVTSVGTITPTHLLGSLLVIAGSLIRLRCFSEMGRHFTFRLSVRDDHKLCTTGPYSIVRHPGYTGAVFTIIGQALTLAGSGSWWKEVDGWRSGPLGKICALVLAESIAVYTRVILRVPMEDEYLRKEFKEEWEEWARRVPYRFIPGIY